MKTLSALFLTITCFLLSSCSAIAGIFKAGVWVGVLFVVAIVGIVIFIIAKLSRKK